MAEQQKISVSEVRKTIATSLAGAFGFVIALMWNQVVQGGLALAGVSTTAPSDAIQYATFIGTAVVITVIMIIAIVLVGRLAGKGSPSA